MYEEQAIQNGQYLFHKQIRRIKEWNFYQISVDTLRCVILVVCVTNEREESVVKQHN